jgi:hypothetical protein
VKDKLDKIFSLYIRLRDSDHFGYGNCVTCNKRVFYKEAHCGHFMSRRHLSTRWDEDNCALQCVACNLFNQGRQYEFSLYLKEKAEILLTKSRQTIKLTKSDYLDMINKYKVKVKELEKDLTLSQISDGTPTGSQTNRVKNR